MPLDWPGLTQEIDQVFADVVGLQVTLVKKAIAFTASTGGVTKTARPIVFNAVRMTRHDAEQAFGSLLLDAATPLWMSGAPTAIPQKGDLVMFGGERWNIEYVDSVGPTGKAMAWKVQLVQ
jgi:hypothetical protein